MNGIIGSLDNSCTGYKSANLIGTVSEKGIYNVAIFSSITHLGSDPALLSLLSRKAGDDKANGTKWISKGKGDYSIETVELEDYGTTIILDVKKAEKEFIDDFRIRGVISKYSDHITVPIMMKENNTLLIVAEINDIYCDTNVT